MGNGSERRESKRYRRYLIGASSKSGHGVPGPYRKVMRSRRIQIVALFLLAGLMFLASGLHGSYFCVSPWAGQGPMPAAPGDAQR